MREWTDWVKHHAMLFALLTDAEERMLHEWAVLLGLRGWTPEELCQASEWLAVHEPPQYRSQHLKALESRLTTIRRAATVQTCPEDEDRGQCVQCCGGGLVSVPNPRGDGLGGWGTMAVACDCALGNWFAQHGNHLTLRDYALRHAGWKTRLEEHAELLRRQVGALARSRDLDAALGAIKARQWAANAARN